MSSYMRSKAQPDDFMMFTGPYGSFYLRPTVRPVLMLAGGTGLAPFLSMLLWLKDNPTEQPIRLAYGVNTNDDLVEMETLAALKALADAGTIGRDKVAAAMVKYQLDPSKPNPMSV